MKQTDVPPGPAGTAAWPVLADATPVSSSAASPVAAAAIAVTRPSACLIFTIVPRFPCLAGAPVSLVRPAPAPVSARQAGELERSWNGAKTGRPIHVHGSGVWGRSGA